VAFVDPRFLGEQLGTSGDDHPPADIRNGEAFLARVYAAVTSGPEWPATVLVLTFDEWGGFFDHVPPPLAPLPAASRAAGDVDGRLGFRVPCLVIAPWARRGHVAHGVYDHTSVLRLIEWRWGLAPLTVRDGTARNLAEVLDFGRHDPAAPALPAPAGPFGGPCPTAPLGRPPAGAEAEEGPPPPASPAQGPEWAALLPVARRDGWPV
jgi:phospholipase C